MSRASDIAKKSANQAWARWAERQIKQRLESTERLESSGRYVGYNAKREKHQVRLNTGKVVDAESITNAGLMKGDRVVVSRGKGASRRIKAMPR